MCGFSFFAFFDKKIWRVMEEKAGEVNLRLGMDHKAQAGEILACALYI